MKSQTVKTHLACRLFDGSVDVLQAKLNLLLHGSAP